MRWVFLLALAAYAPWAWGGGVSPQAPQQGGAQFVVGSTIGSSSFRVGSKGGSFLITPPVSLESVRVTVPPNALAQETELTLGFNNGVFLPRKGIASGYIVFLTASQQTQFLHPVTITITTDKHGYDRNPMGFSVDGENGSKIRLLDSTFDRKNRSITFYTFRPLMFTWLYT